MATTQLKGFTRKKTAFMTDEIGGQSAFVPAAVSGCYIAVTIVHL
jgi:hypothetical protein